MALPAVWLLVRSASTRAARAIVGVLAAGAASGALLALPVLWSDVAPTVTAPGTIAAPSPVVFVLVPVLVAGIALGRPARAPAAAFAPYFAGTAVAALVVVYAVTAQPAGSEWNYYPAKLSWLWIATGLPLLLVPAAHPHDDRGSGRGIRAGREVALSAGVLLIAAAGTRVSSPLLPPALAPWGPGASQHDGSRSLLDGWDLPDAQTLAHVVALGDDGRRVVLWDMRDPGNDRLGNFWLATYDPIADTRLTRWAYGSMHTEIADLCALLEVDADRVVLTRNPALVHQLSQTCGTPPSRVELLAG
jgi:hypothetical protein